MFGGFIPLRLELKLHFWIKFIALSTNFIATWIKFTALWTNFIATWIKFIARWTNFIASWIKFTARWTNLTEKTSSEDNARRINFYVYTIE